MKVCPLCHAELKDLQDCFSCREKQSVLPDPDFSTAPLLEGRDFFYENGLMVFTREYHLRRGFCCGNNCRNCPYRG